MCSWKNVLESLLPLPVGDKQSQSMPRHFKFQSSLTYVSWAVISLNEAYRQGNGDTVWNVGLVLLIGDCSAGKGVCECNVGLVDRISLFQNDSLHSTCWPNRGRVLLSVNLHNQFVWVFFSFSWVEFTEHAILFVQEKKLWF